MQFANVDEIKTRPKPKLRGTCPHCGSDMISRCGRVKVWHWAHKRNPHCNRWWESETQWHRDWKNCFPIEWQEISHTDSVTQEIHIADVKNPFGLVIEFQHSRIKPEEREAREDFYDESVGWVGSVGSRCFLEIDFSPTGSPIFSFPILSFLEQ